MFNSMGVSWGFTPSLLLGPPFLHSSWRSYTYSRGILLCAACSVTGDSSLGMVVMSPVSLHDSMYSFVATLALVPVPTFMGRCHSGSWDFSGCWQPLGLPAWLGVDLTTLILTSKSVWKPSDNSPILLPPPGAKGTEGFSPRRGLEAGAVCGAAGQQYNL